MRASPPGTYPTLTGQPAPSNKQPRSALTRDSAAEAAFRAASDPLR
jgi:hypothetical protein